MIRIGYMVSHPHAYDMTFASETALAGKAVPVQWLLGAIMMLYPHGWTVYGTQCCAAAGQEFLS